MKQIDANNEVTYYLTNYFNAFNVFKYKRNLLDMAIPKEEYFTEMLDH